MKLFSTKNRNGVILFVVAILTVLIVATTIIVCCNKTEEQAEKSAEVKELSPIYMIKGTNAIETMEGVTIMCTANYQLYAYGNSNIFQLSEWEYEKEDFYNDKNYDWNVKFISNGKIYRTDFIDYKGNVIATEKCNGSVVVDTRYKDDNNTYIDYVVLYIEYEGNQFSIKLERGGL